MTNITPLGLYNAINSALKRQENKQDLGDLKHAEIFGTAIKRVKAADLNLVNLQADRALCVSGLFAISKAHAWPTASDEIGAMAEYLESVFLLTPWTSTQCSKADLMAREDFAEIMLSTSKILRDQYKGNQPLVQEILGPNPPCLVPVQTAICILRKQGDQFKKFSPPEVQQELAGLSEALETNENFIKTTQEAYFHLLLKVNPNYKERGLWMKLNSKRSVAIAGESEKAWQLRKQYNRAKNASKRLKQKRDAFLREFQAFEIGVDDAALDLLKGPSCKDRNRLVSFLKSICKHYASRWCIETGYETIEYHFPIQYQGYSSDTHLRVFTIQTIVFNSYRVAQIKHIGATKPANWRPWEPKNKTKCRRFDAKDQRSFSTKTHLLGLLKESLEAYFCRALS